MWRHVVVWMRTSSQRLKYLISGWLARAVCGKAIESLGDGGLLEGVRHWGQALRVCSLILLPVLSLCFAFVAEDVISQLPVPVSHGALSQQ